jgi:hypothetical protein
MHKTIQKHRTHKIKKQNKKTNIKRILKTIKRVIRTQKIAKSTKKMCQKVGVSNCPVLQFVISFLTGRNNLYFRDLQGCYVV